MHSIQSPSSYSTSVRWSHSKGVYCGLGTYFTHSEHIGDSLASHIGGHDDVFLFSRVACSHCLGSRLCDWLCTSDQLFWRCRALHLFYGIQRLGGDERLKLKHLHYSITEYQSVILQITIYLMFSRTYFKVFTPQDSPYCLGHSLCCFIAIIRGLYNL